MNGLPRQFLAQIKSLEGLSQLNRHVDHGLKNRIAGIWARI